MKTTILFIALLTTSAAIAQIDPVGKDNVAIAGYDVVAYFNMGKAMIGNAANSASNNGIIYYFTNEENKNTFLKNPEAYLPQYDGYCALAVGAQNKKVSINPREFKITNGKLYLFFNGNLPFSNQKFNSVEPWNKDEQNLIQKADANWVALKSKKR